VKDDESQGVSDEHWEGPEPFKTVKAGAQRGRYGCRCAEQNIKQKHILPPFVRQAPQVIYRDEKRVGSIVYKGFSTVPTFLIII